MKDLLIQNPNEARAYAMYADFYPEESKELLDKGEIIVEKGLGFRYRFWINGFDRDDTASRILNEDQRVEQAVGWLNEIQRANPNSDLDFDTIIRDFAERVRGAHGETHMVNRAIGRVEAVRQHIGEPITPETIARVRDAAEALYVDRDAYLHYDGPERDEAQYAANRIAQGFGVTLADTEDNRVGLPVPEPPDEHQQVAQRAFRYGDQDLPATRERMEDCEESEYPKGNYSLTVELLDQLNDAVGHFCIEEDGSKVPLFDLIFNLRVRLDEDEEEFLKVGHFFDKSNSKEEFDLGNEVLHGFSGYRTVPHDSHFGELTCEGSGEREYDILEGDYPGEPCVHLLSRCSQRAVDRFFDPNFDCIEKQGCVGDHWLDSIGQDMNVGTFRGESCYRIRIRWNEVYGRALRTSMFNGDPAAVCSRVAGLMMGRQYEHILREFAFYLILLCRGRHHGRWDVVDDPSMATTEVTISARNWPEYLPIHYLEEIILPNIAFEGNIEDDDRAPVPITIGDELNSIFETVH